MALFQSDHAKRLASPPTPYTAGAVQHVVFSFTFSAAFTSASDKLELGILPAGAQVVAATVIGEGLGAITADVGIMSGEVGAQDDTRTVGTDFFDDQSVNDTEHALTALEALGIAADHTQHRSIGVTLSGDVTASASKKIHLVMEYTH